MFAVVLVQKKSDQPTKTEPVLGVAVSVTVCVPAGNVNVQVAPQLMPAGLLVIVPVPFPTVDTVSVEAPKVAVTVCAALIAIVHSKGTPVTTVQFPLQPRNE